MGLTTTKTSGPNDDLKAFCRFVRNNKSTLEEVIGFRKNNRFITPQLQKLIDDSDNHAELQDPNQRASDIIDSWMDNKAWSFMRTIHTLPYSLTTAISTNMKLRHPLSFFKVVRWLSKLDPKTFVVNRFRDPRLADPSSPPAPSIAQYISDLYASPNRLPPPHRLSELEHPISSEEVMVAVASLGNKAKGVDGLKDTTIKQFR